MASTEQAPSAPGTVRVPTLESLRRRRHEILKAAAAHDVSNVRVFGSVARGDADGESDVDFLVDVPPERRGLAFFGALDEFREELEGMLGVPVDVVSVSADTPRARAMLRDAVPL